MNKMRNYIYHNYWTKTKEYGSDPKEIIRSSPIPYKTLEKLKHDILSQIHCIASLSIRLKRKGQDRNMQRILPSLLTSPVHWTLHVCDKAHPTVRIISQSVRTYASESEVDSQGLGAHSVV